MLNFIVEYLGKDKKQAVREAAAMLLGIIIKVLFFFIVFFFFKHKLKIVVPI